MNTEQAAERFAPILSDWACVEAYVGRNGAFYYRYDAAAPVTEPGQITYNKYVDGASEPEEVHTVEFHEAQKGYKLK